MFSSMTGTEQEPRGGALPVKTAGARATATYIQFTDEDVSDGDPTYYVGSELEEVIGYPSDRMMDDKDSSWWDSLLHPEDRDRYWASASDSYDSGKPYLIEYRIQHSSGDWIWIREEARLISEGNRRFWMGTLRDVTDLHPPA